MNSWCVGDVIDMDSIFREMDTFNDDISGWDTSSVTAMGLMFYYAISFDGNISSWNTASVVTMAEDGWYVPRCYFVQQRFISMEYNKA